MKSLVWISWTSFVFSVSFNLQTAVKLVAQMLIS